MSHDFLDPFTQSEIGYRRARLADDWQLEQPTRRRSRWRKNPEPAAENGLATPQSADRHGLFQPLFETYEIDQTLS